MLNLRRLSNALKKHATGSRVIACWAGVAVFVVALGSAGSSDKVPLDLLFFYTPERAYSMIGSYGEDGRAMYRIFELTVDVVWPLVYTLALSLTITWLLQRGIAGDNRAQFLNVMPLGAWLFDLLENSSIVVMLSVFPERPALLAWVATGCTMAKWIFVGASLAVLVFGILSAVRRSRVP